MEDQESLLGDRRPYSNGRLRNGIANAYQYAYPNTRRTGFWRISFIVPCLFLATLFLTPFYMMNNKVQPKVRHMEFRNVVGYFLQDDQNTDSETFNYTAMNFGLKDRVYDTDAEFDPERQKTQWERFENHIVKLNNQTPANVQYKVLYLGRHGEGYHNIKETEVGKEAWDCYWSHLDGDANSTWADSNLAPTGVAQALVANDFWQTLITTQKISPPQSYYVSPLTRCLETCSLTFSNVTLPPSSPPFIPIIKELLREGISSHTCDRRRSRTYIQALAPTWQFESKFPEEDPYWRANYSETHDAENRRFKALLDDIFTNDNNTFISLSSHSGAINTILRVIGHRTFSLKTGAVIPVLLKGQSVLREDPNPIYKGPVYAKDPKICSAPPSPSDTPKPVNDIGLQKPGEDIPPSQPPAPEPAEPLTPAEPNPPIDQIPPTEPIDPAPIEANPHPTEQTPPQNIEENPPPIEANPSTDIGANPPTDSIPPPPANQDSNAPPPSEHSTDV
ncbi:7d66cbbe-ec9e-4369-bedd-59b94293d380 [Sclerotinia trifoliorum]|uniref:7d66cbbe-ec9e-4369-bedd-59b94293d380 n=1 Tax=Sclerotinia trifoliorum TaxID=28548 RepID=A0A8H2W4X7_9HELO|nr:7d66cbbe-ec9e-4369-bedd-59b94293d380 [Sclerotinia trifoliorum]